MAARYTLIVGTKDWSSWSLRPYMALKATGVPFDEELIRPAPRFDDRGSAKAHARRPRAGAEDRGERRDPHGLGQPRHLRDAGRAPSRGGTVARRSVRARRGALLCRRDAFRAFPICASSCTMDFARTLPTPDLRDATKAQIARILDAWTHALEPSRRRQRLSVRAFLHRRLHVCAGVSRAFALTASRCPRSVPTM